MNRRGAVLLAASATPLWPAAAETSPFAQRFQEP